jgi:hypothetical protein
MVIRINHEYDELINRILDSFPQHIFKSIEYTFLSIGCATGQIPRVVNERYKRYGLTDDEIKLCHTIVPENPMFGSMMVGRGIVGTYKEGIENMKFDAGLTNPPYLKGKWSKFTKQIAERVDHLGTINPSSMVEGSSPRCENYRKWLKENNIQEIEDCTASFPKVDGGNLAFFMLNPGNKTGKSKGPNLSLFEEVELKYKSLNKLKELHGVAEVDRGYEVRKLELSEKETKEFNQKVIVSVGKGNGIKINYIKSIELLCDRWSKKNIKGKYLIFNRFYGKNKPGEDPVHIIEDISDYIPSDNILYFKLNENETLENFNSVYGSNIYRKYLTEFRGKYHDTQAGHIKNLPRLDLTRTYSEEEIEKIFE